MKNHWIKKRNQKRHFASTALAGSSAARATILRNRFGGSDPKSVEEISRLFNVPAVRLKGTKAMREDGSFYWKIEITTEEE